jgi:hypothetical protein
MNLSTDDLLNVEMALEYAIANIHNEIATCPDVRKYALEIAEYQAQREELAALLKRVEKALGR